MPKKGFWRDQRGASAAEFTMVVVVFLILVFGAIDFGRALWEWNQATKATQYGVRMAIVNNMVAEGLQTFDGLPSAGGNGDPVPIAAISPNPVTCNSSGCNGYGPLDTTTFNAIVSRMKEVYIQIEDVNVVIEYRHIGLGFAGNPFGPDIVPAVTVKLRNMTFQFTTPGLAGLADFSMPDFATTLTGEDMTS